jgi:hypothetical protein
MVQTGASFSLQPQFPEEDALAHPSESRASRERPLSFAALWAKNYIRSVTTKGEAEALRSNASFSEAASKEGRQMTSQRLKEKLSLASAEAWSATEKLLSEEIRRHGIDPSLVDPWAIARDSHNLFDKVLNAYAARVTPRRLSVLVGNDFGQVRKRYTAEDPRAIGFVSMQFHYTGQTLLNWSSIGEKMLLEPYFKVMDDHLYMPLRAAYEAAAKLDYNSPQLRAVRHLLPHSTKLATSVCQQVISQYPGYRTHSGLLSSSVVKTSSIRDVEMFQIYLCLCVLEDNIRAVQRELFPLCAMLYPRLNVNWRLVQDMLKSMGWEIHDRLHPEDARLFLPYLCALNEMFSSEVFEIA